jgi:hypothetical protein
VVKKYHYIVPILEEGGKAIGAVDIQVDTPTGSMFSTGIGFGDTMAVFLNAVQAAAGRDEVKSGSFEVRLLDVNLPARYHSRFLWLKSLSDGPDLIYVIGGSASAKLTPGTLITEKDFSAELRALVGPTAAQGPTPTATAAPTAASGDTASLPYEERSGYDRGFNIDSPTTFAPTIPPLLDRLPPVSPADASPADAPLAFAQNALEQAATLLRAATRETHGGFVEGALAELTHALDAVAAARQSARAGGLPASPPSAETPDEARLRALLSLTERGGGAQPNLYGALTFLKLALLALQETPGGDLNGLRPRLTATLALAATSIVTGIGEADARNTAAASRAAPPAVSLSNPPAPSAPATAAGRWLDAADTALRNALGSLGGAGRPEHGGFVERAMDEILTAAAETRVAAVAERESPADPRRAATFPLGYDQLLSNLATVRPPGLRAQSNMTGAQAMLRAALLALQNAPGGDLAGARDRIVAAIARANAALRSGIEYADTNEARSPRGNARRGGSASSPIAPWQSAPAPSPGPSASLRR